MTCERVSNGPVTSFISHNFIFAVECKVRLKRILYIKCSMNGTESIGAAFGKEYKLSIENSISVERVV